METRKALIAIAIKELAKAEKLQSAEYQEERLKVAIKILQAALATF